jgi:isoquinoline 1-oxidoreductase subunit beta
VRRREFIRKGAIGVGGLALTATGGGVFAIHWLDDAASERAELRTAQQGVGSFAGWLQIGADDSVTIHVPIADMGQGSHTALAQMLAEELDVDITKVRTVQAPAEPEFAIGAIGPAIAYVALPSARMIAGTVRSLGSFAARAADYQQSSGSAAISTVGQYCMRVVGAAARLALIETAAKRLAVGINELTTVSGSVVHAATNRTLRYGELALEAAERKLAASPALKPRAEFTLIGKSIPRADVPDKVNGAAIYGIDFTLPDMRIATVKAAPVRGGKLLSVDTAPAMAIVGVEKVISLDTAVVVVAKKFWAAQKGLAALKPSFSDGGNAGFSTPSIYAAQDALRKTQQPDETVSTGDAARAFASPGAKSTEALYRVPFLHHAMMEPFAITAHYVNGVLEIWGGVQAPLEFKAKAIEVSGLAEDQVVFHPMIMGGGFGRRFRSTSQHIVQITQIAMQVPYPVKLIWSREEDVTQGAFRPQVSSSFKGAVDATGRMLAIAVDYAQDFSSNAILALLPYAVPSVQQRFYEYVSNQQFATWRSVELSQHGFFVESFIDELAHLAGVDPFAFRRDHLPKDGRHRRVLDDVAQRAGWGTPLPVGVGRGIAMSTMSSVVAVVVEASMGADGTPKLHRVVTSVDCGLVINPVNAAAQIEGGVLMGLSAAIGEEITVDKGAVVQRNFNDYPILRLAQVPPMETHFLTTDSPIGGLGEMGTPPAAPALANALFAATGTRIRTLPIVRRT